MSADVLQVEGINSKGFGTIPKLVMQDRRLTIQAKAIYAYFCSYAGAGRTAFPSRSKILYDLDIGKKAYYRHFNLLKKHGYIKCHQERSNGRFIKNIYVLSVEVSLPCTPFEHTQKGDAPKAYTPKEDNNNNSLKNNSINNYQSVSQTGADVDRYMELICKNIAYDDLLATHPNDTGMIDELASIMLDVITSSSPTVRINGEDKPRELVKSMMLKLDYWDIDHVLTRYKALTAPISNVRAYLMTMLYNVKMEASASVYNDMRQKQ